MRMLLRLFVTLITVAIFVLPFVLLGWWVLESPQPLRIVVAIIAILVLLLLFYFFLSSSPLSLGKSAYRSNEKMRITLRNARIFNWDDSFTLEKTGEEWQPVELTSRRLDSSGSEDIVVWEAVAPQEPGTYWLSKTVTILGSGNNREKTFRVRFNVNKWSARIGS